jgi:hypothetical protein
VDSLPIHTITREKSWKWHRYTDITTKNSFFITEGYMWSAPVFLCLLMMTNPKKWPRDTKSAIDESGPTTSRTVHNSPDKCCNAIAAHKIASPESNTQSSDVCFAKSSELILITTPSNKSRTHASFFKRSPPTVSEKVQGWTKLFMELLGYHSNLKPLAILDDESPTIKRGSSIACRQFAI